MVFVGGGATGPEIGCPPRRLAETAKPLPLRIEKGTPMSTCYVVDIDENDVAPCTGESAGTVTWLDMQWTAEVCARHLAMYQAQPDPNRVVEVWPRCTVEVLDPYDRVSLVDCGERADERGVCNFHRRMIGCS